MKEGSKKHKVKDRIKHSIWSNLLESWHYLLGSSDYLLSLKPDQVANFDPKRIQKLATKIGELPLEGIEMWSRSQFEALTEKQLSGLSGKHAQLVAGKGIASVLACWIKGGKGDRFIAELPTVILGLEYSEECLEEGSKAISEIKNIATLSEILSVVVEYGSDDLLKKILRKLNEKQIFESISVQIKYNLLEDPLFRQRYKRDMARFVKEKVDYESFGIVHKEAVEEVSHYERSLKEANNPSVRKKIYASLREWVHELPLSGLNRHLINPSRLFRFSKGQQQHAITEMTDALREELLQSHKDLVHDRDLLWMPIEGLEKEKEHIKKIFFRLVQIIEKHRKKLELLKDENNFLLSSIVSFDNFKSFDDFIKKTQKEIRIIDRLNRDLEAGRCQVGLLIRAVINAMERERLEGDSEVFIGGLPIKLFRRLEKMHDFRFQALKEHPDLERFRPYFLLVEELDVIRDQIKAVSAELGQKGQIFSEARKKIAVWKELKVEILKIKKEDGEKDEY